MTQPDDQTQRAERIAASVRETLETDDGTRRRFLTRSVGAGGALLALGGGTGIALAQDDDQEEGDASEEPEQAFADVEGTDVDVLNYALTLEHLENAFYRELTEEFSEGDFADADVLEDYETGADVTVYEYLTTIGEHEASHVEVLTQAVELLGGNPVAEATYDFGVETVGEYLELAQVLENTGVGAYAGAAPFVESPDLLGAALSIHSVEARHAAFLNDLNGTSFFPDAYDSALSQQEVLDAVGPLIETSEGDGDNGADDESDGADSEDGDDGADGEDGGDGADGEDGADEGDGDENGGGN